MIIQLKEPPNPTHYTSIKDVSSFKFNPHFKTISLHIQIYNDAFGITNNTNTKLDIFYFTIMNLPYWMQSSRDDIYCCLVCKSSTLKEITHESLLEYFIEDIKKMNNERIQLSDGYEVELVMHSNAADNEASNKMMSIENFKAMFCKGCTVHYNQLNQIYSGTFNLDENPIKTRDNLPDSHAFNSLDESNFFNMNFFYTFDPFHDFSSSGIMLKVLRPMICIHYLGALNFRRDLKNFAIKKSKLLEKYKSINHKNGTISDIDNDGNVAGTNSQMTDFFLLFGYLDECVPRDSDYFKLYLKIRSLYLFLMSENIPKDQVARVNKEIISFLHQYHQLYTKSGFETIIPKMHHLQHYSSTIEKMGNPRFFSCIKYERKHQTYKRSEKNSNQFKNKALSIAKWEVLTRKIDFRIVEEEKIAKSLFDTNEPANMIYLNFLDNSNPIQIVKEVKIKKIKLKPNNCFRLKKNDINFLMFVKINRIFKQNEEFVIVASRLKSVSYLENRCVYNVENLNELMSINIDDIYHNELIFIEKDMQIVKDFCLDSDFSD